MKGQGPFVFFAFLDRGLHFKGTCPSAMDFCPSILNGHAINRWAPYLATSYWAGVSHVADTIVSTGMVLMCPFGLDRKASKIIGMDKLMDIIRFLFFRFFVCQLASVV